MKAAKEQFDMIEQFGTPTKQANTKINLAPTSPLH